MKRRAPTIHQDVVIGPDQAMSIIREAYEPDPLQRRLRKLELGVALTGGGYGDPIRTALLPAPILLRDVNWCLTVHRLERRTR